MTTYTTPIGKAQATFEIAQKIVADRRAADDYAAKALDSYIALNGPNHRLVNTEAKRGAFLRFAAASAAKCAEKIVADGRAYYEDEHGLIVCTLAADASAGPVGYDRW